MENNNIVEMNYKKDLREYHRNSSRHVLVLETDMSEEDKRRIFHESELVRKAGNELIGIMKNNLKQLNRTKRYRKLQRLFSMYASKGDLKNKKKIADQMKEMQIQYNLTRSYCRKAMIPIAKKYGIGSIFGLTKSEDVWSAVERCLYADGKTIHFVRKGILPGLRAKQPTQGIIFYGKENSLTFKVKDIKFGIKLNNLFEVYEVNEILNYMSHHKSIDEKVIELFKQGKICIDTFRPCYAILVCKRIRNKLHVYIHIIIEGKALPKYNKYGLLKHEYGQGIVGCDIGTATIAYTSENKIGLKNLGERGPSIKRNERKERLLQRAMNRSRRLNNIENYNDEGVVKKGAKTWYRSKRYMKLKKRHAEFVRKNSINRYLAINEDVNDLRSLGNILVTEFKNSDNLKRNLTETTRDERGRYNSKKRFGRTIQIRCPGHFQDQVQKKFISTGGTYIEVPSEYRASQYDHTNDTYVKKLIHKRMYKLSDGTKIQRDWYSSFLLYCINLDTLTIDKQKCKLEFERFYLMEKELIDLIVENKIRISNSGIRVY